jgi:uncharacterized SAM-binding protein YcdF (DUF218 family)
MLRRLLETLILPPLSVLALFLLGTVVKRWRKLTGQMLQALALIWLWLAATPCVGGMLLHSLQSYPPLPPTATSTDAQAIVVLSAGSDPLGSEYGSPVIGPITLQRLRYAVSLQRRLGLPILVSGGRPTSSAPTLARMMKETAEREFGAKVRMLENRSSDTRQNARFSSQILKENGIERILLVTSAWHMPRAMGCFEHAGMAATAAPTGFRGKIFASWTSYLPHWNGLRDTCLAMHEWGGRLVYACTNDNSG